MYDLALIIGYHLKHKNKKSMIKYQNYSHYKLPITINPLEYGKLILKILDLNLFVVQINKTNVVVIKQIDNLNKVKLFKSGDFLFEYTDLKVSENSFVRTINNRKFTFNKSMLSSIEKIINRDHIILILLLIFAIIKLIFPDFLVGSETLLSSFVGGISLNNRKGNIVKLRKIGQRND
jgi:hypothetical protein